MRAIGSGFRNKTITDIDLTSIGALSGQDIYDHLESFSNIAIQFSWTGLVGTPTIGIESTLNGTDYDAIIDSAGADIEFTPTGGSGSETIIVSEFVSSKMRLNISVVGTGGEASATLIGNN